jgi:2-polyprenyl-3-methyl-5-hydroxy-6-metoxy-1,4-benzoquinol methylase
MDETAVFEQAGTIEKWDRDYYHPIAERYYDHAIPAMLCLMGVPKGATILDAGCGPGVHSIRAAHAGCKVTAIDVSEAMLREARSRVAAAGVAPAVEFRQEDLTDGGHLQACAARLKENGYVADYGVCGGKTVHEQQAAPFSLSAFAFDDYVPGSLTP